MRQLSTSPSSAAATDSAFEYDAGIDEGITRNGLQQPRLMLSFAFVVR